MTTGNGRALLEVADLDVFLGESHVLHGVSLDVPEHRITALLGRNGVGKTTTLRGILGLVARQGSIRYDGDDLTALPTHEIVQKGIAYVPEDREIFSELTVSENLRLAERGGEHRYDLVYELFPRLQERTDQPAGTLSGGEQQMVALGRALLNDNRLLLVDEPTKGLAPNLVTEVAKVLERIRELTTCLLVEQNLQVVRRLAEDAIVLDQGRVVYRGSAQELLDDPDRTRELLGVASSGGVTEQPSDDEGGAT
ncbi:MAG: ABC transporter ATP-binding protein [Nitriliruptorales bacterium]|nr:ABC transporter ATP-binding protein [Nitriliruptorales bacterium]